MSATIDLPAMIQRLPLFADLKKGELKKLEEEKHCRLRRFAAGTQIVRQGALDTEFFVVLDGIASAYVFDSDQGSSLAHSFVAGDWFGEMSAISHQPRSATVIADTPCSMLMLDVTLFQILFGNKAGGFRRMIDERYRRVALSQHLRSAPLFKGLPADFLAEIASAAELSSYEKDDVIAREGAAADAVYLVRCGIVKRTRRRAGGEIEIQEYLCDNSSFGERSLRDGELWSSTFTCMSQVDVVRVDRTAFDRLLGTRGEAVRSTVMQQVQHLDGETTVARATADREERLEALVGKETIKGGEALVIDLKKCTRCNACVESCVAVHEDRVPRLSKRGIRIGVDTMLSSACYNCKIPECMLSCKFGAIRRDGDGQIHIISDNCVGCSLCESHCPYGVIRMAHLEPESAPREIPGMGLLREIPFLGRLFREQSAACATEAEEPKAKDRAKAIKCDLCQGLPFEACVYNCPCGAISRRRPDGLELPA